ncbi:MAG: hypothetical protein JKY11_07945 [Alphaproteobacteria bacterium]|nr:hypothetical protein [Alphaproteobacteria bacterium]
MVNNKNEITIIVPNSAGYAIDAIGMIFQFTSMHWSNGEITLMADERFKELVEKSALDKNLNISVKYPFKRTEYPGKSVVSEEQIDGLATEERYAESINSTQLSLEDVAHLIEQQVDLIDTPAGKLPKTPHNWMSFNNTDQDDIEETIDRALLSAPKHGDLSNMEPVFLFYWGGKPVTDTEEGMDARQAGGALKSVSAEILIEEIKDLQESLKKENKLLIPVFAQYGSPDELKERMAIHNDIGLSPKAVQLGVDWNDFYQPAELLNVLSKKYKCIAIGNGNTTHHLMCAATNSNADIIILHNGWKDTSGEERWEAAASASDRIHTIKALHGSEHTYYALLKQAGEKTGVHLKTLIEESNIAVTSQAVHFIQDRLINTPELEASAVQNAFKPQKFSL